MKTRYLAAALALVTATTACDSSSGPNEPGRMTILLTDAPGDVESAVVTISRVYLQSGSDTLDASGRIDLMTEPVTVDLLDLRNVAMELVGEATVPGGTYSQLRMVITGGYIEVEEGTGTKIYASSSAYAAEQGVTAQGELHMPSYAQSGLKISLPSEARRIDGDQQIVLLDFNVAQSFGRQAGNSGRWVMQPVVRATDVQTTATAEFTLSLGQGVTLPTIGGRATTLADFEVVLDRDGDEVGQKFVSADGAFRARFNYLEPGRSYAVRLVSPAGMTATVNPSFPTTISTNSGATVRQSFTITAISTGG